MEARSDGGAVTGAQALLSALEHAGVEVIFGIPGAANLPVYDLLYESPIRHILVRHEQGAGHAAEGYAQATGKVGVCLTTSGPGATNLVTALADAYMDSVPIVAITGQVASTAVGTDAFQEADVRGITMPITKHNFMVTRTADIAQAVKDAFHIAATGRPGPVLIDITKDALASTAPFDWPKAYNLPGYKPTLKPHVRQIREAARMIAAAQRPVLYIGGGVLKSGASAQLRALVKDTGIPVVATLMAQGAFPSSDPLCYGMPGMHGTVAAVGALQRSDLIIAIGARFDDRVTGRLDAFAPDALVIHADVDPAEIGKNRAADVPIVGDAKAVLTELHKALADEKLLDLAPWRAYLDGLRRRYPLTLDEDTADGALSPQFVIQRLGQLAGSDAMFVTGVGQHQMWASHFLPHERPGNWATSGGLGTMGYCLPALMGAKVGRPDTCVWGIDGDGSFQMTEQELTTCSLNDIPVKIAIINNFVLGMIRQHQKLFYGERYSNSDLFTDSLPDFCKLAEAMGAHAIRVRTPEEVDAAIEEAMAINDRPVLVEFQVAKDAMVWPMVPAGSSPENINIGFGVSPRWQEEAS